MVSEKRTDNMNHMPTLLAPAGSMRPFMTALRFGADAVYCGAKQYGLRAQAGNFDEKELEKAVRMAHEKGVQVNLFVCGDQLIGGDILSLAENGFQTGLAFPKQDKT